MKADDFWAVFIKQHVRVRIRYFRVLVLVLSLLSLLLSIVLWQRLRDLPVKKVQSNHLAQAMALWRIDNNFQRQLGQLRRLVALSAEPSGRGRST